MIDEYEIVVKKAIDCIGCNCLSIYPYGRLGKRFLIILKKYGINVYRVYDEKEKDCSKIYDTKKDEEEYLLIASDNEEIYDEIRNEANKYFKANRIIDIFDKNAHASVEVDENIYLFNETHFYLPNYQEDYIQHWIYKFGIFYEQSILEFVSSVIRTVGN